MPGACSVPAVPSTSCFERARSRRCTGRKLGLEVVEASPAAAAGLHGEDIILDIDGAAIETPGDLQRLMFDDAIGRRIALRIFRDGHVLTIPATLAELRT